MTNIDAFPKIASIPKRRRSHTPKGEFIVGVYANDIKRGKLVTIHDVKGDQASIRRRNKHSMTNEVWRRPEYLAAGDTANECYSNLMCVIRAHVPGASLKIVPGPLSAQAFVEIPR